MADSESSILLRIFGDSDDAKRHLLEVARQVEQFDSTEGTATADVDATPAKTKLRDLFTEFAKVARERVSARVDADTAAATAGLRGVDARADALDAKRVDVEVDVDTDRAGRGVRGFLGQLGGLFRSAGRGTKTLGDLSQLGFDAVAGSAGAAAAPVEGLSGSVGTSGVAARIAGPVVAALAGIIGPVFVATVGSLAVAFAALASSLTLAAGAAGALAVGFAAALGGPAILLAIGAVDRFKQTVDKAGSAANELKRSAAGFMDSFRGAVAPGADAVFRGLADALKALGPVVKSVGPGLAALGRAVGDAFRALGREFAKPEWIDFFRRLFATASRLMPPLTALLVAFARVARNLVDATLPLLADAAGAVGRFASGAGSAEGFSKFLAGAIPHLASWVDLMGAIADVFLSFVREAAPFGKQLVDFFAEGARNLAEWVRSAEGQEQIKRFFEDTLPLVEQVAELFGRLGVIALQAFQALAPALTGVFDVLNFGLGLVQRLLGLFNQLDPVLRGILFPLGGAANLFGLLSTAVGTVIPKIGELAGAIGSGLSTAVSAVGTAVKAVVDTIVFVVTAGVTGAFKAAKAVATGIRDGIVAVAESIRETARGILTRVVAIVRGFVDNALAAGKAVFNAVRNGIAAAAEAVRETARRILERVVAIVRGFVDNALSAGRAVFNAVRNGIAEAAENVREAARSILDRVIEIIRNHIDKALTAGKAVFNAVRDRIGEAADGVKDKAQGIADKLVAIVTGLADAAYKAGKALVTSLKNGIADGAEAAIEELKGLAGKLKGRLPGSEPKDPTSPLRGLGDAGRAVAENFAAGMRAGAPLLARELSALTAGIPLAIQAQFSTSLAAPVVNLPAMLAPQPQAAPQFSFNGPWASGHGAQSDGFEAFARFAQIVRDRGGLG